MATDSAYVAEVGKMTIDYLYINLRHVMLATLFTLKKVSDRGVTLFSLNRWKSRGVGRDVFLTVTMKKSLLRHRFRKPSLSQAQYLIKK